MQPILLIIKHLHTIFQLGNVSKLTIGIFDSLTD